MDVDTRLARQKLAAELLVKRSEHTLARKQLALAEAQLAQQSRQGSQEGFRFLFTPTGVVLIGAALGLLGTAAGKYADYVTTKSEQETSIILKASDVSPDVQPEEQTKQRARNLLWFNQAGYITLPGNFVEQLTKDADLTKGQVLPAPIIGSGAPAGSVDLVSKFEAFYAEPREEFGQVFVGYGHLVTPAEQESGFISVGDLKIAFKDGVTEEEGMVILAQDMQPHYDKVDRLVKVKLTGPQRDALASFDYNTGALATSTLLKELNAGHYDKVPDKLLIWTMNAGKEMPGLKTRRNAEIELWRRPE
jgi:GH24 family phage-related lysozyme (muramidase)